MFTKIHNQTNNETVFAVVRLNKENHAALKAYMAALDNGSSDIVFPHGVRLVKQGFGWYRLVTNNEVRGVDKINYAVKLINRWYKEKTTAEHDAVEAEIKRIMPAVITNTKCVALVDGKATYAAPNTPEVVKPADPKSLAFLAQKMNEKFSSLHRNKRA